ncbi:MAG: HAMP domain-containing sensor histidine kinase [Chitinophagales bacterium]|nr:HAMP domain-containing sensor histidine kinase [Chitinophagales bacterium]
MSKLLNKPFKAFTIYALVILACSIPVYYFVVNSIWMEELDEHNLIIKQRIENKLGNIQLDEKELNETLLLWNTLQPGSRLTPISQPKERDSVYTFTRQNEYISDEVDRFRGLSSSIKVNGKFYHLAIETNVEEADETVVAIALVTLLFVVLLVAGFIFLNRKISKRIWQPFQNTLHKLKSFDLTEGKPIRFEQTDIEEFEELNQSLHKLIDKNISVYSQQKTFLENASHELQTPLAVLKSKTDLLLQNKHLTAEQSEILNAIELPLSRISRVNKNLLLLAKIDNSQFAETENLDVSTVLTQSTELLADYIQDKNQNLSHEVKQPLTLACNKLLLEILLNNLLINAIRHTPKNSTIIIQLKDNMLQIQNTGTEALNKEKLFKRFAVSSSETASSGLGLSIVKEICHRYQWQINYTFENYLHSFSVIF